MTPEEKQLLEETLALARENNVILSRMQRSQRVTTAIKVLYWVVILALSFGAYWLIQPYVDTLKSSLGNVGELTKYYQ